MEHHAYYIEGPGTHFEAYKENLRPFYARQYERFGIEEARELQNFASLKNYAKSTYFLGIGSLTSEAQQALLKLFEEPQEGTTFVMLLPHGALLPTLRSRMMEYPEKLKFDGQNSLASRAGLRGLFEQQILTFLKGSQKERSDFITKLLKEEDREKVRDFVNALEAQLYNQGVREGLEDIAKVRSYLGDRSPSLKILLEHLALCLPKS